MSFSNDIYARMKSGTSAEDLMSELQSMIKTTNERINQEKAEEIARTATFNTKVNEMTAILNSLFKFANDYYIHEKDEKADFTPEEIKELAINIIKELDSIEEFQVKPTNGGVEIKTSKHINKATPFLTEWLDLLEKL